MASFAHASEEFGGVTLTSPNVGFLITVGEFLVHTDCYHLLNVKKP